MSEVHRSTRALRGAYHVARAAMFRSFGGDAEKIHERMLEALALLPTARRATTADPITVAGIEFPNRVGLAAGLDKDARAAGAWARFGFGFVELGTVTASAQPGNDRPRLFRLPDSGAIINRMGFNNRGAAALARRLAGLGVLRGNGALGIPVGISIGKTKVVANDRATADYLAALQMLSPHADYIAVNVSSPNTPGLRALQATSHLSGLVAPLVAQAGDGLPVFVKLAPDMADDDVLPTVRAIEEAGAAGIIATNTTVSREGVAATERRVAAEAGGLSGRPLTDRALGFVGRLAHHTALPIMGVGGIMSPADAGRMFDAGATLVQLYTGFIYEGPALVRGIHDLRRAPEARS